MTMSFKLKMILTLRPFKRAIIMSDSDSGNSSYACKIVFFLVRVLVKARFPDSLATDLKSQTVLLTTANEATFV
jgi:hypothetical protein